MKQIKLTQNQIALVDNSDFEYLSKYKWCTIKTRRGFYAVRGFTANKNKQILIYMHRQILGLKYGDKRQGDHRDHNTLNNQRYNLRICTSQENTFNTRRYRNSSSQFKGVSWHISNKKWIASIRLNKELKHLGYFDSETEAAEAYNKAAKKYHKEFACLNRVDRKDQV